VIDAKSGLKAAFISKKDLIASKLAAGRKRHLADVEEIRESDASQCGAETGQPSSELGKDDDQSNEHRGPVRGPQDSPAPGLEL
jgi:hypothetical protein